MDVTSKKSAKAEKIKGNVAGKKRNKRRFVRCESIEYPQWTKIVKSIPMEILLTLMFISRKMMVETNDAKKVFGELHD
jgi:hypothetical protein